VNSHHAWSLVCRLFAEGTHVHRWALSPHELAACTMLGSAIKPAPVNQQYVLCPHCNLHRGQVVGDGKGGRLCQCPECGPVQIVPHDLAAVMLNEDWLRQKLRLALEINSRDGIDQVGPGIWRLGDARQGPVILARSLSTLVRAPAILDGFRVKGTSLRVITPKPIDQTTHPFAADIEWLPLQERFAFYGDGISFIALQDHRPTETQREPVKRVYGPFADDFRSVLLPAHGHINLTEAQASVFESLWSFKGEPMRAERIMERAGLNSDKPVDVFKVKARDKGKPGVDRPLMAYRELVVTQQRQGMYSMPCAAQ
jgi:hypothetical protein